ncbi:hypothetical protein ACF0H5_015104 [Mactra antiquata]
MMADTASIESWSDFGSLDRKSHVSSDRDDFDETAHQEHLRLAGIVKGVHADLRRKYKRSTGETELEKIWNDHCQNKPVLSKYADAMHHLAVDHWSKNNQETRIDWCRDVILEYFKQDGLKKVLEKEKRRKEKLAEQTNTDNQENGRTNHQENGKPDSELVMSDYSCDVVQPVLINANGNATNDSDDKDKNVIPLSEVKDISSEHFEHEKSLDCDKTLTSSSCCQGNEPECVLQTDLCNGASKNLFIKREYNVVDVPVQGKIRLLDVGSCFNPFLAFPDFQPIGIDISPAAETVFHCDFLHLRTTDPLQVAHDTMTTFINNLKDPVEWLPRECFHVVVFSLLLEYFPAPYQRWVSCQKAHELLMYNGILVIVTPDSSHQNRNAGMMKSWKVAIESLGFKRWRYVKQEHLHCMVFRKVAITEEEKKESFLRGITADMLYIPQDFHDIPVDYSAVSDSNSYSGSFEDEQFYKAYTIHELPVLLTDSEENDD